MGEGDEFRARVADALSSIARVRRTQAAAGGCEFVVNGVTCGAPSTHTVYEVVADGDSRAVCADHVEPALRSRHWFGEVRVRERRIAHLQRVAHDSGDNAIIHHCAFCGSGAVVGTSSGTVSCEFCHTNFTVQVQPNHPFMPQTVNGEPSPPPGLPGDTPTEVSAPLDTSINETEEGVVDAEDADADATADAQNQPESDKKDPKGSQPPWLSSTSATGATANHRKVQYECPVCHDYRDMDSCDTCDYNALLATTPKPRTDILRNLHDTFFRSRGLNTESYMARLALQHADDRDEVLDSVRHTHLNREA